ncbi:nitroreductase family protein [Vallitalea okinawensis]|uniref:nitroreductase family protein n=1 Tax=Vallitalea okinawensis TaxID=2078660 RepID=UPI000CFC5BD3|nr:nitroreductase family protein [Vallitalea okinawensis]
MESILTRKSVRTFSGESLTEKEVNLINKYISKRENLIGPNGNKTRIILKETHGKLNGKIGTYGVISKAPAFLIAICKNEKDSLLDCGFVFENLVLYLESYGLGTCWLGATFKREELAISQKLESDEFIPIISPVGKAARRQGLKEKAFRKMVEGDKRKDFDDLFYKYDFTNKMNDPRSKNHLEMVRLAPSASNKQPWRVIMNDEGTAHFYLERTPGYDGLKAGYDIQMLDMGIAISHYVMSSGKSNYVVENPQISPLSELTEYVCSIR